MDCVEQGGKGDVPHNGMDSSVQASFRSTVSAASIECRSFYKAAGGPVRGGAPTCTPMPPAAFSL